MKRFNPTTERKIERDWRARRAEYLAETGRTEPSPDRKLSNFAGPEFPERQRRARDLVAALERRAFGRELGPKNTAWDRAIVIEIEAGRQKAGRAGRARWATGRVQC